MRPVTRNVIVGVAVVVGLLLALGALPGLLASGDPYYVTATVASGSTATVNGTALPATRYPYTTAALADAAPDRPGRSDAYYEGPLGFKEAFTHSPFDEVSALRQRNPQAADGDAVYVRLDATVYRVTVTREVPS
jgi:hypothetical protein